MIYFDHNASTNILPQVLKDIDPLFNKALNASSVHAIGREAKAILEKARQSILKLLNADDGEYEVVFTSSGTESNNLIMNNFLDGDIFISSIEHPSIYNFAKFHKNIHIIDVTKDGVIDLAKLEEKLAASDAKRKLISVMLANNETGIIQPVIEMSELAHKYNAYFHSDAVQGVGKIEVDIKKIGVDFMSISGHKFGGMIGAGALIYRVDFQLKNQLIGGGQEKGIRSGTENVVAIAAMGKAADAVSEEIEIRNEYLSKLRNEMEAELLKTCSHVKIVGQNLNRLPNTSLIISSILRSEEQLIGLDMKRICVSAGSACSSGKISKSHVLNAMNYSEQDAASAIRVSLGMNNNISEIKKFLTIYKELNI